MKHLLAMTVLVALSTFATQATAGPDGFRGLHWGDSLDSVKSEMTLITKDKSAGGIDLYERIGEKMHIGEARLSLVWYGFLQGKLCYVRIIALGKHNYRILRDATELKFGTLWKPYEDREEYYLRDQKGMVALNYDDSKARTTLWLLSAEALQAQERHSRKAAQKGAADF